MNIFDFGSTLKSALEQDASLKTDINDQIYPLIAPESSSFPFLTYQKINATETDNKDCRSGYTVDMLVFIFASNYKSLVQIASEVDNAINSYFASSSKPRLMSSHDDYDDQTSTYYMTNEYQFTVF